MDTLWDSNNFLPAPVVFLSCLNNMCNNNKKWEHVKSKGYTEEDLRLLVSMVFEVEDFSGEFIGRGRTSPSFAETCFRSLQKNLIEDKSIEPFPSIAFNPCSYERTNTGTKDPVYEMLTMDEDRIPLYINGFEIEKVMAKWRLTIGKGGRHAQRSKSVC